jgi:acyl-CoA thioesterase FadM
VEPVRRIEHEYRVRFDEADADGRLRPSGLLRYAQDMAWRHTEEAGFDRDWYGEREMNWLVRNVKVDIRAPATYGDVLAVSTQVVGWRHVWARRHSDIVRVGSGTGATEPELMAVVETDWVLLTTDGRPAKVPVEIVDYFSPGTAFSRERVTLPDANGPMTTLTTRVRPLDVDPMRHMNNAAYLDLVDDGLARLPHNQRIGSPDCYSLGYVLPALPDTSVIVACWPAGDQRIACRISDAEGDELTRVLASRRRGPA